MLCIGDQKVHFLFIFYWENVAIRKLGTYMVGKEMHAGVKQNVT